MTMNDVSWACEPAIGAEMIAAVGDVQRGRAGIAAVDVTKRVVDVRALGITGFAARTWLRRHCKINAEFADLRRIVCSLTIGDDAQSADLLVTALSALSSSHTAHPAARAAKRWDGWPRNLSFPIRRAFRRWFPAR